MGKGDKKTKKGKRFLGSYGVTRVQKKSSVTAAAPVEKPKKASKPAKPKAEAEEKPKPVKKEAAEAKPKAVKKEPAEKKAAAPKAPKKKASEE